MMMTTKNPVFKGKFVSYSNINGQEHRLEKEFDNAHDMEQFLNWPDARGSFPSVSFSPFWWLPQLDSWFDDFFDKKLSARSIGLSPEQQTLAELKAEKARIEREEQEQQKKRSMLQHFIDEAKQLKEFFAARKDTEKVAKAQAQIDAYEKELRG